MDRFDAPREAPDPDLTARLRRLIERDDETRSRLVDSGELFDGYHPAMEAVHAANARELEAIVEERGWPGRGLAGEEGCEAAWRVAQHAISLPVFQRRCVGLLRAAVERGEAPAWQAAVLEDRVRFHEGRPQRYGTVCDWNEHGELVPWRIEEPGSVDRRRAAVGLEPLAEALARLRRQAAAEGDRPPEDWAERRRRMEAWARRVGWIG